MYKSLKCLTDSCCACLVQQLSYHWLGYSSNMINPTDKLLMNHASVLDLTPPPATGSTDQGLNAKCSLPLIERIHILSQTKGDSESGAVQSLMALRACINPAAERHVGMDF